MSENNFAQNTILVFDWGNTLMQVLPNYSGPMADWPEVAEVDGIVEALEGLVRQHHMVVATNAGDSNSSQVWKALKRVGLGEYFRAVFTAQELGSQKPDLRFFRQLERVLDRPPYQLVMVGDDFRVDVTGAKTAGWRSVWYNPGHLLAPGLLPLQDGEISDLRDLPGAARRLTLPDYATCLAWLIERGIPYNILAHIQLVAALAYQIAAWLRSAGVAVNPLLAHRGAMLHDLAKIDSIQAKKERGDLGDHAAMARDLLLAREQPELAQIADRHMPYRDPAHPRRPQSWEERLVHYADKLAEGTQLVSLEERLAALQKRYPQYAQDLLESLPILLDMQQEICRPLGITPGELLARLRQGLGYGEVSG